MKHIFFAHSHTLTLSSLGTIEYLKLNHKDCIFLCTRNYIMPEGITDCKVIDANDVYNEFNKGLSGTLLQNYRDIKRFDKFLYEWTEGDDFFFYPPHLGGFFILFSSNKKCKKVSFVQEGAHTISGMFINNLNLFQKIRRWLSSLKHYGTFRKYACNGWYTDGCLPFQKKINVYATSESFFKYMPQEKIVYHQISWPICNKKLHIKYPDAPIFIFDGFVKNGVVDKDTYMSACKRIIKENYKELNYLKFHPAQVQEERNLIMSFFTNLGVKIEIFPETDPFEFYITNCKNMTIIGFSSSLLIYAKDAGHKVIAHSSWLLESSLYKTWVDKGYPVFDN